MKFMIEKKELSALTTLVHRAAAAKSTIPVLSGLLLNLSKDKGLTMTATDMEIGIIASTTNVDIIEEGNVLINANYFADFIKLLPDTLVSIELIKDKSRLQVNYGRSSGYINIYDNEDYPDLPINDLKDCFKIQQDVLKNALKKTSFAAATNHFRQMFTGVLFDFKKDTLNIVASDTHRLAHYSYILDEPNLEPINFIIPVRTVNELLRLLEDNDNNINIAISNNNIIFYQENFILFSRLIDGQYPNYDAVIPKQFTTDFDINPNKLATSLERSKIMPTDDKFQIPNVKININEKEIQCNTFSENMGEIVEIIDGLEINGEHNFNISFNTNYFLDIAKIFAQECDLIKIKLSGSLGPALISNPEKENYVYVLVPLRTSN